MTKTRLDMKEKMRLALQICDEEGNNLFLKREIIISFDHYSPEVHTIFLREAKTSPRRVKHSDIKHIEKRIKEEVDPRWHLNFIASRPEKFVWYTGDDVVDFYKKDTMI